MILHRQMAGCLTVMAASIVASCSPGNDAPVPLVAEVSKATPCDVAAAVLGDVIVQEPGATSVLLETGGRHSPAPLSAADLLEGPTADEPYDGWIRVTPDYGVEPVQPPLAATVEAFVSSTPTSATTCPQVRTAASAAKLSIVAARPSSRPGLDGLYRETTYGLSLPVISSDGD